MTVTVTMLQTRRGEGGATWTVGNSYEATDGFAAFLITSNLATGVLPQVPASSLTAAQAAEVAKISYRRAGNLTTGVGADFNGASGFGKLNLGGDILIPANTLIAGRSLIRMRFTVLRTGSDGAFVDIRIGNTNGIGDNVLTLSAQFGAFSGNQTVTIDAKIAVTTTKYTCDYIRGASNVGMTADLVESASAPVLTQDNYINVCVSGTTAGLYRITDINCEVFQ